MYAYVIHLKIVLTLDSSSLLRRGTVLPVSGIFSYMSWQNMKRDISIDKLKPILSPAPGGTRNTQLEIRTINEAGMSKFVIW